MRKVFKLEIECENDAFMRNDIAELARILGETLKALENGRTSGALFDVNGNRVGDFAMNRD